MRIPADLLDFAAEAAEREGISRTQWVTQLIRLERTNHRIRVSQAKTRMAKEAATPNIFS